MIQLIYNGRFGNRMFQYCLARILSIKLNIKLNINDSLFNLRLRSNMDWEDDTCMKEYQNKKNIDNDFNIFPNLKFNNSLSDLVST